MKYHLKSQRRKDMMIFHLQDQSLGVRVEIELPSSISEKGLWCVHDHYTNRI